MLVAASAFLAGSVSSDVDLTKYKRVEAYQIRPGILMMPRYTADGELCEVGFQRQIYSAEVVRLNPDLSQEEIDSLINQVSPASERGPRSDILGSGDLMMVDGVGETTIRDYENVTVDILAPVSHRGCKKNQICTEGNLALVIKWKNRNCV
jgi:hypothetical protein